MPSKTSKKKPVAVLPSIPKEFIDQMVSGPMSAQANPPAPPGFVSSSLARLVVSLSHHCGPHPHCGFMASFRLVNI